MLEIENKRLHDWIVQKDTLVGDGRNVSAQIEKIEAKIKGYQDKEKKITGAVEVPKELVAKGNALAKEIEDKIKELGIIGNQVEEVKLNAIPKAMKEEHRQLLKDKEALERDRNKIALKVQKIKDRCVPLIQKEVKPLLKEYDDIETAQTKNGKVVIKTFNHLEDFKSKFKR